MARKSTVGAIVVAVVLGSVIAERFFGTSGTPRGAGEAVVPAQAPLPATAMPDKPVPPVPVPSRSMPGADVPAALFLDELRARAARGEAAAACRVAAELAYCRQPMHRRAEHDAWLLERRRALDSLTDPARRAELAAGIEREMALREKNLASLEAHCRDVEPVAPDELARLWRTAALAGDPAAIRQYASGNAFLWGHVLEALPELATYRGEAERLALVGAERGDFELALALASAYAPGGSDTRTLLQQAVPPDPPKALALYRHLAAALSRTGDDDSRLGREVADRIEGLETTLGAKELSLADELGADMARRWQPLVVRGARDLYVGGSLRSIDRRWCGR